MLQPCGPGRHRGRERHPRLGHRGSRDEYPENTILGIKKAIENNVDGVEIELEVSEAKWKVSKQRVLLDGIRLKSLGISDVGHIKGYLDNQAHTQLSSMTTDSNASIKFIADEIRIIINKTGFGKVAYSPEGDT